MPVTHKDVQPPEFIIDGLRPDGKTQKVPFLYQREGETWDQFCARMKRVSDGLNNDYPPRRVLGKEPAIKPHNYPGVLALALIGLLMWWAIWRLVR